MNREESELAADLIRVLLFDLAERVPFGKNAFNATPYTIALGELAARYGVPSITDTNEVPARFVPQVPDGKVRNG